MSPFSLGVSLKTILRELEQRVQRHTKRERENEKLFFHQTETSKELGSV